MVLVTLADFRVDSMATFGGADHLTPHLNEFADEADLSARAVAPAPTIKPALTSLFTGLPPRLHGVRHEFSSGPADSLRMLPEVLSEAGYQTAGYHGRLYPRAHHGFERGFDEFHPAHETRHLKSKLQNLAPGQFLWIHLEEASPPWTRYRRFLPFLPESPQELPDRIRREKIARFYEGGAPQGENLERLRAMYHLNVAAVDALFGDVMKALEQSPSAAEAIVVALGVNGLSLGEEGRVGSVANLHRSLLEVPLLIHLGDGIPSLPPLASAEPLAASRLFATFNRWIGLDVPPAVAPSLTTATPRGVYSEAYFGNGYNEFSWVEESHQIRKRVYFSKPDPEFTAMRRVILFPDRRLRLASGRSAKKLRQRLLRAFRSHPIDSSDSSEVSLTIWSPQGSTQPVEDPIRRQELFVSLEKANTAFASSAELPTDLWRTP